MTHIHTYKFTLCVPALLWMLMGMMENSDNNATKSVILSKLFYRSVCLYLFFAFFIFFNGKGYAERYKFNCVMRIDNERMNQQFTNLRGNPEPLNCMPSRQPDETTMDAYGIKDAKGNEEKTNSDKCTGQNRKTMKNCIGLENRRTTRKKNNFKKKLQKQLQTRKKA